MQESTFVIVEELTPCINQHITELLPLNLQRNKAIIVKTIAEIVQCNVDLQCVKNLESVIKNKYSMILKRLLKNVLILCI